MPATSYPRTANGLAGLKALPIPISVTTVTMQAALPGLAQPGDGNGGLFFWDYASTGTPDDYNIILSNNPIYTSVGRWIRYEPVVPTPGQVADPTFLPADSSFDTSVDVSMLDATSGAAIYFTTDGSDPSSSSTLFTVPVTITVQTTFKAIAIKAGLGDSNIVTKTYTPVVNTVATPVFSPSPGFFTGSFDLSITCATVGADIYYTLDQGGADPPDPDPGNAILYTGAIVGINNETKVKARAFKTGFTQSAIAAGHWIPVGRTNILWGSSDIPLITDAGDWATDAFDVDDPVVPLSGYAMFFNTSPPALGAFRYVVMLASGDPPAATGGFTQSGFNLSPADFAGAGEGYTSTDANGWPYYSILNAGDGQLYRQYRLANELFGSFTIGLTQ